MKRNQDLQIEDDRTSISKERPLEGINSPALFLAEEQEGGNNKSLFFRINSDEYKMLQNIGTELEVLAGETVFFQGDQHTGIFLIELGAVRTFYIGPNGREITLAHWSRGHFVGGPEIFGGGNHIWSGIATEDCRLLKLGGAAFRNQVEKSNVLATCLLEGSIQKGKCYSALLQMLGTRSVIERLAQLLLILSESESYTKNGHAVISRAFTHEELASMVGATRQWVTMTLDKFRKAGAIDLMGRKIKVVDADFLRTKTGI